jgi:hypothetical protein
VLLDWSVRESFHLLHYLAQQDVDRDLFEVVIVEYYSRVSEALEPFGAEVDTWALLEMPESCYYHKHLMYNAGLVLSRGEICVVCDSDAMVKPGFIRTIVEAFERDPHIVLHLDQFRNVRRDFYPFNYPTFEDVLGAGCINNAGGKTRGIVDLEDPIHTRNYGACMCARREDLLAIGGADEHIDYLGHICGPYDMTFRLVNHGRREVWHPTEFMYHTWHPGQAGVDNYLGPHDGRHVSTTALQALCSGRVLPYLENAAIRSLRTGAGEPRERLLAQLIDPARTAVWKREVVEDHDRLVAALALNPKPGAYAGFSIEPRAEHVYEAQPAASGDPAVTGEWRSEIDAASLPEARRALARRVPWRLRAALRFVRLYMAAAQFGYYLGERLKTRVAARGA